MKKFWQKVVAFCLCITVSVSAMVAPVAAVAVETIIAGLSVITAAAGAVKALAECTSSVTEMVSALKEYQDPSVPMDSSMWIASSYWGGPDAHRTELPSEDILWCISQDWNRNYAQDVGFSTDVCKRELSDGRTFWVIRCVGIGGRRGEPNLDYYLCDGNARILCVDITVTPVEYDGTWNAIQTLKSPYCLVSYAELSNTAVSAGGKVQKSGNLYFILNSSGTQYYATPSGLAYAYMPVDESASGSDRPTDSVIEVGGDGSENTVAVDGDNTKIDIENGTFTGLDGTLQIIDGVIYDESTKTYYIDSHDSYNTYNYYTYQYYINYTSITYIGTTEEYDKHYEVYYQLPDGRSSADLTAEELEQLNLSIDVINYGRSADDVSLRSLYHFDGDTDDESYWNYCTDFTWNKGASLTYMDEGTFGGSLYLDETEHDFTLTLPSALSSLDFTLQFRYYQSATAAPQTDSYIKLGNTTVMQFDGVNIKNGSGTTLSTMPVGSWNELAMIRDSGTLYYYLNGVKIGSVSNSVAFSAEITFHFGSTQQTFKKLDELRVLNTTLQKGGASYTPTSVPHDTNLALVLPDTAIPVADEYWKFTSSAENLIPLTADSLTQGFAPSVGQWSFNTSPYASISGFFKPCLSSDSSGDGNTYGKLEYLPGVMRVTKLLDSTIKRSCSPELRSCFQFCLNGGYKNTFDGYPDLTGDYVFSVVTADGAVCSLPFSLPVVDSWGNDKAVSQNFDWGSLGIYKVYNDSDYDHCGYYLYIEPNTSVDLVYMEFIRGTSTDLTAEKVTSITPMTPEDLATSTLAVRSDIPVTTWQIGGVRPSVPTKGQVWALVERQYITSLQIYNGRAWESCDGRIWTGSRWVPYSSYNVVTLKDMSDIVDASSPDHEYIYTESGFWDWLQRWLTQFKTDLFARLDKLKGAGADGSASSSALPDIPADSGDYDFSDSSEDVTLPDAAKDSAGGLWAFIKGVWKLVGGAFQNAGKAVSDLTDAADTTNPDGAFGFFLIPLE